MGSGGRIIRDGNLDLIKRFKTEQMIPKEKAKEIFNKMYQVDDIMGNYPMCFDTAKKCALIAVNEILNTTLVSPPKSYWQEVKNEIKKLCKSV
jgi:hypothetical protein